MIHINNRRNLLYGRFNRRRLIAAATGAGTASVLLASCGKISRGQPQQAGSKPASGGTPLPGGTFATYISVNPATIDAQKTKSIPARTIAGNVMSRPFRFKTGFDPNIVFNHQLENDLATSAESPDAITWTLKLRPDAKFQNIPPVNGHAVEAEDVKATFSRAIAAPDSAAKAYLLMVDPNQIETPDKATVVFKLKYGYGIFDQTLGGAVASWIYPREALAGTYDPAKVVIGSGPFTLESYTPDVGINFKKNASWFEQGRPYIDGQLEAIIPSPAQQLAQFTTGKLDMLMVDQNGLDEAKRQNPKAIVVAAPNPSPYELYGRLDMPSSPFSDIRVRRAISMAIDREAIGKAVFNGQYHNNGVLALSKGKWALPPNQLGQASQYLTYNLDAAKKLVAESGMGDQLRKFVYPQNAYGPQFDTIAQMINPMLNAAGFKTQLIPVDYDNQFINFGKGIASGHYDSDTLVLSILLSSGSPAEQELFDNLSLGGSSNHSFVNDPQLTDMVTKMVGLTNEQERLKIAQDVQRYVADKLYYITALPTGNQYTLLQPRVRNWSYTLGQDVAGTEAYSKLWLAT